MQNSATASRGMAVASHSLAAQSASAVLREGGNALEAMVAAAATIAVAYPHMNGIGGDSFWVIHEPGRAPRAIDACGAAAAAATRDFYASHGCKAIPMRGPLAANTVAGTISGWAAALGISQRDWHGSLPLTRLLADAITYASQGVAVTASQMRNTANKRAELETQPGFATQFMPGGRVPVAGERFVQPAMAATLSRLARAGLDDYYRGELARAIAADLAAVGSPVAAGDLSRHRATEVKPVEIRLAAGTVYNMTPPTQGLISLLLLGIAERAGLAAVAPDSADHVHLLVEATKQAFRVRDRHVTDPRYMTVEPQALLAPDQVAALAAKIDPAKAAPWGAGRPPADTIWMGVIDGAGRAVSFIQSIYHEFGSGVVLPATGINWQNRGCSFALDPAALNVLEPGRKPFHTLNPALALLDDGRTFVYGTMGGDGQPQTQAAVYTRHVVFGQGVQQAISAPRWLLGRTWGQVSDTLKLESRFDPALVAELRHRGHDIELLGAFDETVGHAGGISRRPDGLLEGGFDPRSDGAVAGF